MKQPITILIAALGGEGGGVLAEWLVETALQAGYPAQSTSIPGVAQRTGATTYYVEIYPELAANGRRPCRQPLDRLAGRILDSPAQIDQQSVEPVADGPPHVLLDHPRRRV